MGAGDPGCSQAQVVDLTVGSPTPNHPFDLQTGAEEEEAQAQLRSSDIDDLLQKVIEEERLKAEMARSLAGAKPGGQPHELLGVILQRPVPRSNEFVIGRNFNMDEKTDKCLSY